MKKSKKYRCEVCGYIYDPAVGDTNNEIEPNTPFEELPDEWLCPTCSVGKERFIEIEE
ncbi:MAG: rubredoxin [Rikenellaceae bacterium]|nr:rubredoxin [Rikenellaceae bacterium]